MDNGDLHDQEMQRAENVRRSIGAVVGIVLFAVMLFSPAPEGLSTPAWRAAAVTALMASFWVTEVLPISITAFFPIILFPWLGVVDAKTAIKPYADQAIMLMLGGFALSVAIEKWRLHRRVALYILSRIGSSPRRLILGVMLATWLLSMWISNTATTLMMVPIGMAILTQFDDRNKISIAKAMMLGIAYAASIGGVATLIGTPPNLVLAGSIRALFPKGPEIGFLQWMAIGLPVSVIMLPLTWLFLTRVMFKMDARSSGGREQIKKQFKELGKMSVPERRTTAIFLLTAVLWITRRPISFESLTIPGWSLLLNDPKWASDAGPAILAMVLCFAVPSGNSSRSILERKDLFKIPWDILFLFGGGFSLAYAVQETGLAVYIAGSLGALKMLPVLFMIVAVCAMLTFLTEVTSNTAIATLMMPILATTAVAMETHPFLLMVPAAISASCAFMLPAATAPNAIVFSSGHIRIGDMVRTGFWLNWMGVMVISALCYLLLQAALSLPNFALPPWAAIK